MYLTQKKSTILAMPKLRALHRWLHKLAPTMLIALIAALYRVGQEIKWLPADEVWFPLLALATWLLFLYWMFTGPRAVRFYRKAYKRWAQEKRTMAYGLAISLGAVIGAASGAGWWRLFELHRLQMQKLKSAEASSHKEEPSRSGLRLDALKLQELYVELSQEDTAQRHAYGDFYYAQVQLTVAFNDTKNPNITPQDRQRVADRISEFTNKMDAFRRKMFDVEEQLTKTLAKIKVTFQDTEQLDGLIRDIERRELASYRQTPLGAQEWNPGGVQKYCDAEGPKITAFLRRQRDEPIANLLAYMDSEIKRASGNPAAPPIETPTGGNKPEHPKHGPVKPHQTPSLTFTATLQPEAPYDIPMLAGIAWQKLYVDVRIDLTNGAVPIQNLDCLVGLDTSIAGVGQLSQFPGVTAFPAGSPPAMWLEGTDLQGNPSSLPIAPSPGMMSAAPVYRVHCTEVFANTVVHLVVASIVVNPIVNGQLPKQLFAPRRSPRVIKIKGKYETRNGASVDNHNVEFSKEFTPQ